MEPIAEQDVLYGVAAIARHLGIPEKACRHRIEAKQIPSFRLGGTVCARRSTLVGWLKDQEAKASVEGSGRDDEAGDE